MYEISAGLDGYTTAQPGTNLLVSGSDDDECRDRVLDALAAGLENGEGAVIVSTDLPADEILAQLRERTTVEPHTVAVIDCHSAEIRQRKTTDEGVFVYTVPAPTQLTAIGIGIVECFDRLSEAGIDKLRVGLVSLSTMLAESDEAEIFKFSHVVSSRLDSAGFFGLFTINAETIEPQSYQIIQEAFDDTVELY